MANTEEIADRALYAWMLLPVPVHTNNRLAKIHRVFSANGKPDVAYNTRPLDMGKRFRFAGANRPAVAVAAACIPA